MDELLVFRVSRPDMLLYVPVGGLLIFVNTAGFVEEAQPTSLLNGWLRCASCSLLAVRFGTLQVIHVCMPLGSEETRQLITKTF